MTKSNSSHYEEAAFRTQVLRDHEELLGTSALSCDGELLKAVNDSLKGSERVKAAAYAQLITAPKLLQAAVALCQKLLQVDDVSSLILSIPKQGPAFLRQQQDIR
jgi:hypothetical protein